MIEGQEGVTWPQWQAIAAACEEHGVGSLFRSDHYLPLGGHRGAPGARRLGHPVRARRHDDAPCASARWSHRRRSAIPAEPGQARGHRRPDLRRPHRRSASARAGTSASTRPSASRSPRRASGWTSSPSSSRSCAGCGRDGPLPSRAATTAPAPRRPAAQAAGAVAHRRRLGRAAQRRARRALRRRVQHRLRRRRTSAAGAAPRSRPAWSEAGRDSDLRFSVMTGAVLGRDASRGATARARADRRAHRPTRLHAARRHGSPARPTRRPSSCARSPTAGVDRVMLQLLLHEDVDQIALIGRELAPALSGR